MIRARSPIKTAELINDDNWVPRTTEGRPSVMEEKPLGLGLVLDSPLGERSPPPDSKPSEPGLLSLDVRVPLALGHFPKRIYSASPKAPAEQDCLLLYGPQELPHLVENHQK